MATRSNIGILNKDGSVEIIYCHFDGYLAHNGKILNEHYKNVPKVRKLISLGDISSLAPEIGRKTSFDDPRDGQVVAYGRDRGENDVDARRYSSYDDYWATIWDDRFVEFIYIFDTKDRKWYFTTHDNNLELLDLEERLNR